MERFARTEAPAPRIAELPIEEREDVLLVTTEGGAGGGSLVVEDMAVFSLMLDRESGEGK